MIETILILILFAGAAFYLLRLVYRQFVATKCESGCGKCGSVDFNQIEKKLRKSGQFPG